MSVVDCTNYFEYFKCFSDISGFKKIYSNKFPWYLTKGFRKLSYYRKSYGNRAFLKLASCFTYSGVNLLLKIWREYHDIRKPDFFCVCKHFFNKCSFEWFFPSTFIVLDLLLFYISNGTINYYKSFYVFRNLVAVIAKVL